MDKRCIGNVRLGLLLEFEGKKSEALEHYRIAAEAENTYGQLAYGVGLLRKGDLSGNDWIQKSKAQKYSSAWATKAHHYLDGEYVAKNVKEGIRHLEKAFEYGFQSCAAELSLIYLKGMYGIEKDHHLSEVWAKKSLVGWRKFVDKLGLLPLSQVFSNVIAFGMAKKSVNEEGKMKFEKMATESLRKALGEE